MLFVTFVAPRVDRFGGFWVLCTILNSAATDVFDRSEGGEHLRDGARQKRTNHSKPDKGRFHGCRRWQDSDCPIFLAGIGPSADHWLTGGHQLEPDARA